MKHKRTVLSIAMAALVLVSLCAVYASPLSVSAADGSGSKAQPSAALVGAPVSSAPALCAPNANRVDWFVQGTDHALWHSYWSGPAGNWSAWESLGGYLTSSPAATSPINGVIDVYVRGGDGALWSRGTTNGGTPWSNWGSLGGQLLAGTGPGASSYTDNSLSTVLELFVTGTNHALYQYQGTSWEKLGGYLTSSPAAASLSNGLTDVYVRGGDGALWWRYTTDGGTVWTPWTSLGGQIAPNTGPAACSWPGRLDTFVQGMDGALYHKSSKSTSWSSWENIGGHLTSSPAAASSGDNTIDVFVRGGSGGLWQLHYFTSYNRWSSWFSLGGQIAPGTGPAACSWPAAPSRPGGLDTFVQGMNGALWHKSYTSTWSGWENIGGYLTSSPAATSRSAGYMDVAVRGGHNSLWLTSWYDEWTPWRSVGGI